MRFYSYMKVLLLTFLFISFSAAAGVYKWVDAQGNVHYGDKPRSQKNATELSIDSNANTGVTNSSGDVKERDRMTQELRDDRKAREKVREERQAAAKERQKECAGLKRRLLQHQRANNVYRKDANGERIYYSQAERDAKVKKIKKGIAKNCR